MRFLISFQNFLTIEKLSDSATKVVELSLSCSALKVVSSKGEERTPQHREAYFIHKKTMVSLDRFHLFAKLLGVF